MTAGTAGAAVSDVGRVRASNQDSGYAGVRLFVVADGMGGHAGGDVASSIAVNSILQTDVQPFTTPQEAEFALQSALATANRLISDTVLDHPELGGMGTTVSALIRVGDAVAIAHIGDSRVYLLRDGELSQVTNDHTFVQRLVETGRITAEEAAVHPRRSVLMRVLGDIDQAPEIDTSIIGTVPGDRWMICSDGLSSYVSEERILAIAAAAGTARESAERLVDEALEHGAPDNVTVVVADIDFPDEPPVPAALVGAAAQPLEFELAEKHRQHVRLPALLLHPIKATTTIPEASFQPDSDDYLDALIREDRSRLRRRRLFWLTAIVVLVLGLVLVVVGAYRYTQTRYYVGFDGQTVAVYRGIQQSVGPIQLSHVVQRTRLDRTDLPSFYQDQVSATISEDSLSAAKHVVDNLESQVTSGDG